MVEDLEQVNASDLEFEVTNTPQLTTKDFHNPSPSYLQGTAVT